MSEDLVAGEVAVAETITIWAGAEEWDSQRGKKAKSNSRSGSKSKAAGRSAGVPAPHRQGLHEQTKSCDLLLSSWGRLRRRSLLLGGWSCGLLWLSPGETARVMTIL